MLEYFDISKMSGSCVVIDCNKKDMLIETLFCVNKNIKDKCVFDERYNHRIQDINYDSVVIFNDNFRTNRDLDNAINLQCKLKIIFVKHYCDCHICDKLVSNSDFIFVFNDYNKALCRKIQNRTNKYKSNYHNFYECIVINNKKIYHYKIKKCVENNIEINHIQYTNLPLVLNNIILQYLECHPKKIID